MHFNSENNYYITLGLQQNSSSEEIRERWKKLMLLYHPDRQEGDDSWVSERAKKVNEAYSILKDDEKRRGFDRKLAEKVMPQRSGARPETMRRPGNARSSRNISRHPEWDRTKKNLPKALVGVYIIVAIVFLGYLYLQDNSEHLETVLITEKGRTEPATGESARSPEKNSLHANNPLQVTPPDSFHKAEQLPNNPARPEKEKQQEKAAVHTAITKSAKIPSAPVSRFPQRPVGPDVIQQSRTESPAGDNPAPVKAVPLFPPPVATTMLTPQEKVQEPSPKALPPGGGTAPSAGMITRALEQPPLVRHAPAGPSHPLQKQGLPEITQEEIEHFMQRYASIYQNGNINAFMALFSKSVTENNRLNFNAIRDAYADTFSEKITYYRINNMKIVLSGTSAAVTGIYELNRYTSSEERWIRYSGRIQWKIAKENSELKIVSISYDK